MSERSVEAIHSQYTQSCSVNLNLLPSVTPLRQKNEVLETGREKSQAFGIRDCLQQQLSMQQLSREPFAGPNLPPGALISCFSVQYP